MNTDCDKWKEEYEETGDSFKGAVNIGGYGVKDVRLWKKY